MTEQNEKTPSLWQVAKSVLWAMLGVQKRKNYERDFQYGKPWQYIVLGLVAVVIFILLIIGAVNMAMSLAGV